MKAAKKMEVEVKDGEKVVVKLNLRSSNIWGRLHTCSSQLQKTIIIIIIIISLN